LYIFVVLFLLICSDLGVRGTLVVLQVSRENKSTITHLTQFMVRTEEVSVLYLYTKFEAVKSISSKVIRGPKIWELGHVTPAMPT